MIILSAFADEIADDLLSQIDTCLVNDVRHIDIRGVNGKNVSQLTAAEAGEYRRQLDDAGISVPCIGSPIGKIRLDEDFDAHLELLRHCCEIAKIFGTNLVRVFSFYPADGQRIADQREPVMERLAAMVKLAESADVVLMHENEKAIYGCKPPGVLDIFKTINSPHLRSVFDPANFVEEGVAPYDDAWLGGLGKLTAYLHIKDKTPGDPACVPAGHGDGQIPEILADLARRNWSGVATLEPHLKAAGQFNGFTGPDLFAKAATALRALCDRVGLDCR